MKCMQTRHLLSSYLDGALTSRQEQAVREHLRGCAECRSQLESLGQTQQLLSGLRPRPAPAGLELRLRVAISREAAQARRWKLTGMAVRFQNAFNDFVWPAAAGVLTTVIVFGLLMGFFAVPPQLEASQGDVPSLLYTPPQLAFSPIDAGMGVINADSLVVEAYVDANGRVQDYRIISAPPDSESLLPQLKNVLIFTQFRPATAFGRATTGKAILSFSKINVTG
ncbi:MAG: anti-sigma factor [Terriglobales bacterium]